MKNVGYVILRILPLALGLGAAVAAHSQNHTDSLLLQLDEYRAQYNYQMFCQGCHTPSGQGGSSVPDLRRFMGYFLKTQKGREYLVRVPGSANSVLSDTHLAEVLNWMLLKFADDSLPANWRPYDPSEVSYYRREPLYEVVEYRIDLLTELPVSQLPKNNQPTDI